MHVPDGVLSLPVLAGAAVVAAPAVAVGVRRLDDARLPKAAGLAAAFFALSLVAVPVGPTSVHLLLSALMGLVLGAAAFPAVLIALLLQWLLFGVGGVTTLGVTTVAIALPGVAAAAVARPLIARLAPTPAAVVAAVAAAVAVAAGAALVAAALALSSADLVPAAGLIAATQLPLIVAEAAITGVAVAVVKRVRPELLAPAPPATVRSPA